MAWLIHSQKGSEWKDHKYVKREGTSGKLEDDGKYYYPDSYEGGRHLPKNGESSRKKSSDSKKSEGSDWESKVHGHLAKIIEDHPDMFKSGTDVARHLMDDKNLGAIRNTLKAFGVDTDNMSEDELKQYRKKIVDYYDSNYSKDNKKTTSKSKKKESEPAEDKTEENKEEKKEEKKKGFYPGGEAKKTKNVSKAIYYGGKSDSSIKHSDWLAHHGILGMRWGKKNGPPYPLGAGDHSASEKKAGWRKSLDGGSGNSSGSNNQTQNQNNNQQQPQQQSQHKERHWKNALKEARKEDVTKLSDQELTEYNKRLQMERQFNDLTKEKESSGKKYVKELGKRAFEAIVVATVIEVGKEYFKKKIFPGEKSGSSTASKTAERVAGEVVGNAAKSASKQAYKKATKYAYRKAYRQVLALPMKHSAIGNAWYKIDELEHHGILGMHWGKKNGPPYPLGAGDHSASEKKAGWRKSLDSDSPNKTSSGGSDKNPSSKTQIRKKLSPQEATKMFKSLPKDKKFLEWVKKDNGVEFGKINDPELKELTMMYYTERVLNLDW